MAEAYESLFDGFIARNTDVQPGVMMREPALKYKGKVFAFFYKKENAMCFKLGKGFPLREFGVTDVKYLSPFENKSPMTAWYLVDVSHLSQWPALTQKALDLMRA